MREKCSLQPWTRPSWRKLNIPLSMAYTVSLTYKISVGHREGGGEGGVERRNGGRNEEGGMKGNMGEEGEGIREEGV